MKILVVQIGKIGDMVLTTPLFRAIHQGFPGVQIHVLASHRGASVIRGSPRVKKIFIYRKDPLGLLFLLSTMRSTRYDFLIDPKDHFSTESAIIAKISRAEKKVGFNRPGKKVFSQPLPAQEENFVMHACARNLLPLQFLGIPDNFGIRPELFPDPLLQAKIRERYSLQDAKTILLNISTGDACRRWEIEKWSAVARQCLDKGFQVILSFLPSDAAMAQRVKELQPRALVFNSQSIGDMIALIPLVGLVVTPDTSIVHIASAFNVPQVALFPPVEWNLNKFRPLSDQSIVLQPKEGSAIASIRAQDVIAAIDSQLE
jgi:ADP-heptose:LPS heptosyltransferase